MIHKNISICALILGVLLAGCTQAMAAPTAESTVASPGITTIPTLSPPTISQSSLKPIELQIGNKRVSLTLVQNGEIVPITVKNSKHATVTLAPDTFTIRLEGNKEATRIVGQTDESLLLALESYTRPLVTFDAGTAVFENNDLWIYDPPLEFSDDLESFFATSWGSPERVQQLINDLKSKFGTEPVMIFSGFTPLDPRLGESGFTIRTIDGIKPTDGRTLFITVFLWGDSIVGEFYQLDWFTFHISFVEQ